MSVRARELTCEGPAGGGKPAAPEELRADFERRMAETGRLVYQVAYSVLANAADAEEVAQDVFLRAYRKWASLRDPSKFRAWVARMSWRLALNRQRSWARSLRRDTAWFEVTSLRAPGAEKAAARQELESRLRQEIGRLPEKLRAVLLLCAVEDLDAQAVAEILAIPPGTVRSRLHLARKTLLRRLLP